MLVDVDTFVDEDGINSKPLLLGLVSDEGISDHLLGSIKNLFWGLKDLDSSLHSGRQHTLSSSSSMDLSLDNESSNWVQLGSDLLSLLSGGGNISLLDSNVKSFHDNLRLILMQIEKLFVLVNQLGGSCEIEESLEHLILILII